MCCQCVNVSCVCSHVVNPFIITDPQSQLAIDSDIINFTCIAIAFPVPSYNWFTPIPNGDFNTSTITILVDYSNYGNYTCFADTIAASQPALLTGNYIVSVCLFNVGIASYVCMCIINTYVLEVAIRI